MTKMGGFHKINCPVQSVAKFSPTPYETGDIFSLGVVGYVCFPYVADFHPPKTALGELQALPVPSDNQLFHSCIFAAMVERAVRSYQQIN